MTGTGNSRMITAMRRWPEKDVVFTITVNAITKEDVPELNDEFVKSVSETSKTVKEYKKEVKSFFRRMRKLLMNIL